MNRILFVTGKLAEPALRQVLVDFVPEAKIEAQVAVLPITVAALLTTRWVSTHLKIPENIDRIILPGLCSGEMTFPWTTPTERGPKDVRDLPEYFGRNKKERIGYGRYDIEILAEINHAPQMDRPALMRLAKHYRDGGANIIDLGCDPGNTWTGIGEVVANLKDEGFRISVDSFDSSEVESALANGAELVLSVNGSNTQLAKSWRERFGEIEVVAIPDTPDDLESLYRTVETLQRAEVRHRLDPILEPIGFGFAASLGRYLEVRRRYPDSEMMMGIGNLTELTDVDSAGINVVLAGFCQEVGVRSVLATEVINWARSAIREFDIARQLVHYAVTNKTLPKRLDARLVMLRDPKLYAMGVAGLRELAVRITDSNYRLFVEAGEIHILNNVMHLHGNDPFELFDQMMKRDPKLDPAHSFYLGYEMAKMVTALTLSKNYLQDQALNWGFLTLPEISHRGKA